MDGIVAFETTSEFGLKIVVIIFLAKSVGSQKSTSSYDGLIVLTVINCLEKI